METVGEQHQSDVASWCSIAFISGNILSQVASKCCCHWSGPAREWCAIHRRSAGDISGLKHVIDEMQYTRLRLLGSSNHFAVILEPPSSAKVDRLAIQIGDFAT
jgi:hypothetical protein